MERRDELNQLTGRIIHAGIDVHRALGPGLLESTYEKCLSYKLEKEGMRVQRQCLAPLKFEELLISDAYRIDLIVNESVIVEIKAVESLNGIYFAQVLTYLKAMDLRVGLLMNFNSVQLKDGIHRVVNNF